MDKSQNRPMDSNKEKEGNGPSEEPSGSLPASSDFPSPAATTAAQDLRCRAGAEGSALQRREPPRPLLDYRSTVRRVREISSYQADYWACAIPDSLPPSPDRSSPHWNPNKEYEDLLDYAYPLKPRLPGHDHHSLPHHSTSKQPLSSRMTYFGEVRGRDDRGNVEDYAGLWQHRSSQKPSRENTELYGWIHRNPPQGLHLPTGLRDTLDGMCLNEPRVKGHPKKSQQSESLIQCVKLEELIRWLYTVVDATSSWVPPSPDAESVSASLHRYLEFRKDVADHRSLTESVLERGEALLDCMASNSPALKDTLCLIAKQSEELESHAEQLYKSILAAVGPARGEDAGQDKGGAAHGCSLGKMFTLNTPPSA
ncbi:hypothetical protein TURU_052434 [Turdus rufiventris]|nr:hypothetical protein TURU_052434 [Turdus rufiventris]